MPVRDYIPDDVDLTPSERRNAGVARRRVQGGMVADWLPDKDTPPLAVKSGKEYNQDAALKRAMAAQASAASEELQSAIERLKKLNVVQAVNHITQLPYSQMELYLAAESLYGNRKGVLEAFPPVDPAVVDRIKLLIGADAEPAPDGAKASDPDDKKE